ncbi:MAG: HAD family phosphatase [Bacteroidales bacterium]|nr:HAD family phosphatase [Bacteroidales bacterium]
MSKIKNIVFDYGAVLVDWDPHHLYDPYFGSREKADWFLTNVCTNEWNFQMDSGKPFVEAIDELISEHPEWEKEIRMYFDRWIGMMGDEIPGMQALVRRLKAAGYGVYGLTNWSAETFCQVRNKYVIFGLMDGMVVSGEERIVKPDAAIYRLLMERYGLRAEESLFVDDRQPNIDGAKAVGMGGVLFRNAQQLEAELKAHGLNF